MKRFKKSGLELRHNWVIQTRELMVSQRKSSCCYECNGNLKLVMQNQPTDVHYTPQSPLFRTPWAQSTEAFPSRAHFTFVFNNYMIAKYAINFIVNSEGYIKQFIQQQCCVSWIEETNSTDRTWPCQTPQEKKPVLCIPDVELPNNNVIQSQVNCTKYQVLQKPM